MDRPTFLATFGPFADKWSAQTGIPSSVFLAIIASESNWGEAPTLFGIKGSGTAGSVNLPTTEVINGQRVQVNDTFAANRTVDDAFRQFVDLISQGRYKDAWDAFQQTGDANALLTGLNQAGYATDPNWGDFISRLAGELGGTAPPQQALRGGSMPQTGGGQMDPEALRQLDAIANRVRPGARWADLTGDDLIKATAIAKAVGIDTTPSATAPKPPLTRTAYNPQTGQQEYQESTDNGATWHFTGTAATAPKPPEQASAPSTRDLVGPDNKLHTYAYNQKTGKYDLDQGLAQVTQEKLTPAQLAAQQRQALANAQNRAISTTTGGTPPPPLPPPATTGGTAQTGTGTGTGMDLSAPQTFRGIDPFTGQLSYTGTTLPIRYVNPDGSVGYSTQTYTPANVAANFQQLGLTPTGNPETDFATLIGAQQQREILGPFAPDLPAIQQQEALHRVPKGTYKEALGNFTGMANTALVPLLPSLLSALPNPYDVYQNPSEGNMDYSNLPGLAGGGTVYAGVTDPLYPQQASQAYETGLPPLQGRAALQGQGVGAATPGVPFSPEQQAELQLPTNQFAIPREHTGMSSSSGMRPVVPGSPRPQLSEFGDISAQFYNLPPFYQNQIRAVKASGDPFALAATYKEVQQYLYDNAVNSYYGLAPVNQPPSVFVPYIPSRNRFAAGGSMVTPGPQALVDMNTGRTNAVMGEAGPERLDVTPLTPRPQDITLGREQQAAATPFALLVEQLFAGKRKGRVPPLRPVGATMGG